LGTAALILGSVALPGFAAWSVWRRRWLVVVFLGWFIFPLLPVLPLRDHVTTYYLTLPLLGLAMTGAIGLAHAWEAGRGPRVAAVVVALGFLIFWARVAIAGEKWWYQQGRAAQSLVNGVAAARELHPGVPILLTRMPEDLFWRCVYNGCFAAADVPDVFISPDSLAHIGRLSGARNPAEFALPLEMSARALAQHRLVVYAVDGFKLREITAAYAANLPAAMETQVPRRVDAGNPLAAWLLGPAWYQIQGTFRWMPGNASVTIAGPQSPAERLYISGYCPARNLLLGPLHLAIAVDDEPLAVLTISKPDAVFEKEIALPSQLLGKPSVTLNLSVDRTTPDDGSPRRLGLVFGTFEIRR